MTGVNEFRSLEHAEKCMVSAQKHIDQFKVMLPAIIIATILVQIGGRLSANFKIIGGFLGVMAILATFVIYTIHGTWGYIGKFIMIPMRTLGEVSFLFWLPAMIGSMCFALLALFSVLCFPLPAVLYERYLCGRTVENAKGILEKYGIIPADVHYVNTRREINEYDVPVTGIERSC